MNWTNADLRKKGREALRKNYWKTWFITILYIIMDTGTEFTTVIAIIYQMPNSFQSITADLQRPELPLTPQVAAVLITLLCGLGLLNVFIKLTINIFLKNPALVGSRRFMLRTIAEGDNGMISDIAFAFDSNYKNHVKVVLLTKIKTALYMLLLVVPGIIKSYEYRMVTYLLSENPELPAKEAMEESRRIMEGHKLQAFLLDLSFIPWHLLSLLTLGMLEIFYVDLYENLTGAEFYKAIKQ